MKVEVIHWRKNSEQFGVVSECVYVPRGTAHKHMQMSRIRIQTDALSEWAHFPCDNFCTKTQRPDAMTPDKGFGSISKQHSSDVWFPQKHCLDTYVVTPC